jgi:hypothetical protein
MTFFLSRFAINAAGVQEFLGKVDQKKSHFLKEMAF